MRRHPIPLFRNYSIGSKIFVSILVFLVIPFVITFYWSDKPLEAVIERKIGESAREALTLINFNVEIMLQDMLKASVEISKDQRVITLLKEPETFSEYEKLRLKYDVLNNMNSSFISEPFVTLIDWKGTWYSTKYIEENQFRNITNSSWYNDMKNSRKSLRWMFNYKDYLYLDNRPIVTLVRTISDPQTNDNLGLLIYGVAERDFRKYLSTLDGDVYLIDSEGTVVSSTDVTTIGQNVSENSYLSDIWSRPQGQYIALTGKHKQIINFDTLHQTGWKIAQIIPYDTVFKEIFAIRRMNIGIVFAIFIVFMMITWSISYSISRPLKLLNRQMLSAEKTNFDSMLPMEGTKEIATLIRTYNKMARQIRSLLERVKEEFQQKEDMRFQALQAQINPHFILNTLNNIKWMAYIKQDREVGDMLSSLGIILESSIGRDSGSLISLRQELHYIENYISLMKLKYNERLSVHYEVPDELLNRQVIKFILQPIIENSINHGIEPTNGLGKICISAREEEGRLIISVRDNGAGMNEERLKQLMESLRSSVDLQSSRIGKRIGLRNVQDRIRLQYGSDYGLRMESVENEGTLVELVLPSKREECPDHEAESAARR